MDTTYSYEYQSEAAAGIGIFMLVFLVVMLAIAVLTIIGMWKCFSKAGRPGWAAIIPFYNAYIIIDIAGKPSWWIIWFILPVLPIPFINSILSIVLLVFEFIILIEFARKYGRSAGFGVGLVLLSFIFFPILGFGSSEYIGDGDGGLPGVKPPLPENTSAKPPLPENAG